MTDNLKIEELRDQFESIDREILSLLGKRQDLSKKMALLKKQYGIEIVQNLIWEKHLMNRLEENKNWSLDTAYIKTLFSHIHKESIRIQNSEIQKINS